MSVVYRRQAALARGELWWKTQDPDGRYRCFTCRQDVEWNTPRTAIADPISHVEAAGTPAMKEGRAVLCETCTDREYPGFGYCPACDANMLLLPDGSCSAGHAGESITSVRPWTHGMCWYCKTRPAMPDAEVLKKVSRVRESRGLGLYTETAEITVPRCAGCQQITGKDGGLQYNAHLGKIPTGGKVAPLGTLLGSVAFVAGIVLGFVAFFKVRGLTCVESYSSGSCHEWSGGSMVLSLGASVATFIVVLGLWSWPVARWMKRKARISPARFRAPDPYLRRGRRAYDQVDYWPPLIELASRGEGWGWRLTQHEPIVALDGPTVLATSGSVLVKDPDPPLDWPRLTIGPPEEGAPAGIG